VKAPTVPQSILAVLADGRAAYAYQLARAAKRPIRRVYVALNRLRIRGIVERTGVRSHYRYRLAQPMDKS
jgi:sugar-specific transcriptional regulator TrmB